MMVFSIRTLTESIKYKVEFQLLLTPNPVRLLELEAKQLHRLIILGFQVDDNVRELKERYKNVFGIPAKKFLSAEEKLSLKNK